MTNMFKLQIYQTFLILSCFMVELANTWIGLLVGKREKHILKFILKLAATPGQISTDHMLYMYLCMGLSSLNV